MTKQKIRTLMRAKRRELDDEYKRKAGFEVCKRLLKASFIEKAKVACVYVDCFNEVPTRALISKLIASNKRVCVPLCNVNNETMTLHFIASLDELAEGAYGIPEPSALSSLCDIDLVDAIIVPGLAFDFIGSRIGFGKGYYDKLLAGASATKIGLCYEFQIIDKIPADENDIKMNYILTERNLYKP